MPAMRPAVSLSGAAPLFSPAQTRRIPVEEFFPWQRPVISFLTTPPVAPSKGDRYKVTSVAVGLWVGHEEDIVRENRVRAKRHVARRFGGLEAVTRLEDLYAGVRSVAHVGS